MKKLYFLLSTFFFALALYGQDLNPNNSHALLGSCLDPDEGTVTITLDLGENCPEADPNGVLPGTMELGFHSGANDWGAIAQWDGANAATWVNDGNDIFTLTLNTMDYWGVPFADMNNIRIVGNNGIADPGDPWTIFVKDSVDAELFGNIDVCSDLVIWFDKTPTCSDLNQESSLSLFSDAGDTESCVDEADGLVFIEVDYALNCLEADANMDMAGAAELGFHSGINNWAASVEWDNPNAMKLVNDGNDNFSVLIDVAEYYGVPFGDVTNIQFKGNLGPGAGDPWAASLADPRGGGPFGDQCSDIIMVLAEAPVCDLETSTIDKQLQHSFKLSPNPFHNRTFLEFDNPNNAVFDLEISNMSGQVVRTMSGISGERVLIERDGLPTGMFIARMTDADGNFATTKLVVK
ncbi:MAG: T9SS type A sorting domain-containing protein [Bacteroidota bacterium]